MPTYEYACKSCEHRLEVVQRFTDDPLTECPECEGPLRKVFGNVGITFKGSGFYKTDSRSGSKAASSTSSAESSGSSDSGSSSSPDSGSSSPAKETKKDTKSAPSSPAAAS